MQVTAVIESLSLRHLCYPLVRRIAPADRTRRLIEEKQTTVRTVFVRRLLICSQFVASNLQGFHFIRDLDCGFFVALLGARCSCSGANETRNLANWVNECFYEKVVKVKAAAFNLARLETRYTGGWYEKSSRQLYVNRGIGTTIIPIRVGARTKITILELVREF